MPSPFRGPPTDGTFFASSHARVAELKLAYAVEQAHDVALLVGGSGLGKTKLLRRAAARAAAADLAVIDLFYPRVDAEELLDIVEADLAEQVGAPPDATTPRPRRIAAHVRKLGEGERGLLITIDDAHLLRGPAAFDALRLLLNLREREGVRITLLLAGQPQLLAELAKCPALAGRVGVTASLAAWSHDETARYLRERLAAHGRTNDAFPDAAAELVHERSAGVPRVVSRLCAMALLVAESEGRTLVTPADVEAAARESCMFACDAA